MSDNFVKDLERAFEEEIPNASVTVYENTDSTNTQAKLYAKSSSAMPAFFIAKTQSGGRGRRGRRFVSREGGLYLSYLFSPKLSAEESIKLTVFAAVAISELIEEMTDAEPKIKWVNDVLLGGKKLAGILTEGEFDENGEFFKYAVVGIGINLHKTDFPEEICGIATDLESESDLRVDICDFAVRLAKKLMSFETADAELYMQEYRRRSAVTEKRVKILSASEEFFAEALSVEDDGALYVKLDTGEYKKLYSAEVSVILN